MSIRVPSATPYSLRRRRTSTMSSWSAPISCSAATSWFAACGVGQGATIRSSGRAAPSGHGRRDQSSEVMKGTIGCSRRNVPSSTVTSVVRAASRLPALTPSPRRAFTSSRYQSQSSPQKKW